MFLGCFWMSNYKDTFFWIFRYIPLLNSKVINCRTIMPAYRFRCVKLCQGELGFFPRYYQKFMCMRCQVFSSAPSSPAPSSPAPFFSSTLSLCYACDKNVSHKQETGSKIIFAWPTIYILLDGKWEEQKSLYGMKTNWCHYFIRILLDLYMFRAQRPIFRRVRTAVHTTIGSVSVPLCSRAVCVVACLGDYSLQSHTETEPMVVWTAVRTLLKMGLWARNM